MVGIFSRFSVSRASHRRTQSAFEAREVLPTNSEATGVPTIDDGAPSVTSRHGVEIAAEFKPVEHPPEPVGIDHPIQCPLPEPSVLNDGRIWKERVSTVRIRKPDIPVSAAESEVARTKPPRPRPILPSISAPERTLLKLLEESGIA